MTALHDKAVKADWHGVNADVSKGFVGKTAGEFGDAAKEATSVHNILRDTRDELKGHKERLHQVIENGRKKNLTVLPSGDGGFTVTMAVHPDHAAHGTEVPGHSVADEKALRDEVQKILDHAATSDGTASGVLMALMDESKYGFSDVVYKDRDQAAKAVQEADRLAKLARKDPKDLTAEDFDAVNAGLKQYHSDPLFAEEFAERLGPKGTMAFWLGLNDGREGAHLAYDRGHRFDDLQKNLSLTLATASQSDSSGMTAWKQQVITLGNKPVGDHGGVLGFQVMSNLMRNGDFEDTFMTDYGRALMRTERFSTDDGKNVAWQANICPRLNYEGTDGGWDPLNGYLKGLANNPAAATDFFNEDFVPKDGDHEKAVSNFEYLFKQRQWPMDIHDTHDVHSIAGQNYLAQALEAATTGHPAGEMPTPDTPAHTSGQTYLFQEIVSATADTPEILTDRGYMSDSMGEKSGEISGTLSMGRMEAIGSWAKGQDDSFDHAVAQYQNLLSGGIGTVVGAGTSFIGSPLAGAVVGGAAGTATGSVLQMIFQDAQGNAADNAQDTQGMVWQHGHDQNGKYTERAAELAVQHYHLNPDLVVYAGNAANQGYNNAWAIIHGQSPGSAADIP
ncbi:hypothetical protein ACF1GT_28295 [Streptomyces sp. NPDC014636]|uniref:hypothetical protein n=2 Tax=Streptomyces TaxID=1883 RepID=UPI0036F6FCC5